MQDMLLSRARTFAFSVGQEVEVWRRVVRDQRTPWLARALVAGALAYALSPLDLIPDFIPVIGHIDDVLVVPLLISPASSWACLTHLLIVFADGSNSRARLSMDRPERWSSMIRARNSSGYGGLVFAMGTSSPPSRKASIRTGQLQLQKDKFMTLYLRYALNHLSPFADKATDEDRATSRNALDEFVLTFIDVADRTETTVKVGKGQGRQCVVRFSDGTAWTIPPDFRSARNTSNLTSRATLRLFEFDLGHPAS